MKALLIIIGLIGIALIIKACMPTGNTVRDNPAKPASGPLPPISDNDKIVVIKGAKYEDVRKAVKQFCNSYNKQDYAAIPRLTKISEAEIAITFPYDLTFDIFCYFVNYIYYPENIFYKADIKAWVTPKSGDTWITEKSAGKKVMLFIPPDDKDYDNVFLTTQDNIGYRLGFAAGEETQLLDEPKQMYIEPAIAAIQGKPTEEIK